MFNGPDFPATLDEEMFSRWLENGRTSKIRYHYMLVVWDGYDAQYRPVYTEHRDGLKEYEAYGVSAGRESLVAAYDLYSESRII